MSFRDKKLPQGFTSHYVYERGTGNRVIVVIDDECGEAMKDPSDVNFLHQRVLPLLRKYACQTSYIRAIGFFRLFSDESSADDTLAIIRDWVAEVTDSSTQVYFLLDVLYGENPALAAPHIVKKLTIPPYSYPRDHIAYLTQGAPPIGLPEVYDTFLKVFEAEHLENHEVFSPKLMSFLGIDLHENELINGAIQFYANPWEARWPGEGWAHDELQNKCSDHLRALADWLKIDVNDLCDWQEGQSAKSLMIWVPTKSNDSLWGTRRRIQGEVLKAAMEKLKIPVSKTAPIPEESIKMPCTPCLPFLISLRSFLSSCEKHEKPVPVKEIQFRQDDKHCGFRLILKKSLEDPDGLKNRYCNIKSKPGKHPLGEHPLAKALVELTYCITDGLEDVGRYYMRLFTEGTERSVIEVKEINEDYIELIW